MCFCRESAFIVIEGIDGAGKTTVAKKIVEELKTMGFKAEYTYEPTSSPFSQALKQYIEIYNVIEPEIETLAMALDRLYHVKKIIIPLLKKCFIVVSDRYLYSSIAYQGAQGVDLEWINSVNKYAVKPDIAIYLRVPLNIALERIKLKNSKWSYFENIDRLKKAQEIYEKLVLSGELISIDATRRINEVVKDVLNLILNYLKSKQK